MCDVCIACRAALRFCGQCHVFLARSGTNGCVGIVICNLNDCFVLSGVCVSSSDSGCTSTMLRVRPQCCACVCA